MESISADEAAERLFACCEEGSPWRAELLDRLTAPDAGRALFTGVIERLADRFEPRLCDAYVELMADAIACVIPDLHATHTIARYERVRRPRRFAGDAAAVRNVVVLSRVTLGADVAITSVLLDTAKRAFPNAAIYFAGSLKSWELFAADPRLRRLPVEYSRGGSLRQRLEVWPRVRDEIAALGPALVIDPDSRLTQLGLLPVCSEEDYFFFESRAFEADSPAPLSELAAHWAKATFDIADAQPFIATGLDAPRYAATCSLGVGENLAKRVSEVFERELVRMLPRPALVDTGAGGAERERTLAAVHAAAQDVTAFAGSFAKFASAIARSGVYAGYDSAGGHVAAACGVPAVIVFGGAPCERFRQRWTPSGRASVRLIAATVGERNILQQLRGAGFQPAADF